LIHLHRHSQFSRLDGTGTAKQYADRAAELGQPALAQTDHGTLSGALHHIEACRQAGIFPISGVEAYFRPDRAQAKTDKNQQAWHLCLFAKNMKGWHSLLRIVSTAYGEVEDGGGFYQYPAVDWELLERHREGLVASTACFSSWLARLIYGGDSKSATEYLTRMKKLFGDDLYIEIMPHDFDDQRTLNTALVSLAQEHSIPLIATNDAHFPYKEWAETQRVAKMMGSKHSFEKIRKLKEKGEAPSYLAEINPTLYLAHEEEMRLWFQQFHPDIKDSVVDESIRNTELFVERMSPFMLDKRLKLPRITKDVDESARILKEWIAEGFERIAKGDDQVYLDRADYEFGVLSDKGALDYFVLLGMVVRWAKSTLPLPQRGEDGELFYPEGESKKPIRVGPGRGSAAGCLISYLVGITNVDPIPYGLLFERFLNVERKGMPDIDVDFQRSRRGEVKKFVGMLIGEENVADIITHTTFQPKKVIQDLCRVFDVNYVEAQAVTDTIDIHADDEETTLEELLPLNDKLQEFQSKYPNIWEHAIRLEGQVANAGKHAAGIVVTDRPVYEYMALERGKKGDLVTSWSDAADFPVISDYGFPKYDFLGLTELDKQGYACDLIEQNGGEAPDLDNLPVMIDPNAVDPLVMEGFSKGYTVGVFQFGSRGITSLIRDIEPDSIFDLTAANALYRPGPMKGGVTWDYATLKHNQSEVEYWHEIVMPYLEQTYGLIAYQEQVMQISQAIGGFSGGQADDLRKAMGKLYRIKGGTAARDFMRQFEEQWFEGAKERGVPRKTADEIWHKILQFGSYGFNKSHSACYALEAYKGMYLKMHHPAAFYAAILTYPSGRDTKEKEDFKKRAIAEARARGIKILPPCVNRSNAGWAISKGNLRMGLLAIKGVGDVAAAKIIKDQPYESVEDFQERTKANKSVMEACVESGALDRFGARDHIPELQIALWEKARLNMSLTVPSPTEKYSDFLDENLYTQDEVIEAESGSEVIVGGEIAKFEIKKTKRGDPFCNITLVYSTNEYRVKLWQRELQAFQHMLVEGSTVLVNGTKDEWNGFVSVVARQMAFIEDVIQEQDKAEV